MSVAEKGKGFFMSTNFTADQYRSALDRIQSVRVCVIGDLVLDRYVWGDVSRISPEAPVPVVHINRVEDRLGCAGNAAVNLRKLGAELSLCSVIGEDEEGRSLERLLGSEGISPQSIFVDQRYPSIVKTRVIAHSQQVVRIDKEVLPESSDARVSAFLSLLEKNIGAPDVIIISDYGKGTIMPEVFDLLSTLKTSGKITCPIVVDPHPANFKAYKNITIAKPNRAEAERATGIDIRNNADALNAAKMLMEQWSSEMMMVTLGEGGLVLVSDEYPQGLFLETVAKSVYDVSGAGDTVTAVFAALLGSGTPVDLAGSLANIAAGIVVSEVGTVPITREKLSAFLSNL